MAHNIYGDRTDDQGRPADEGDASPIDGRTASEALKRFAKVKVTFTVEVPISVEEYAALDAFDDMVENGVIHRGLDRIREDFGRNREEEVADIYID